MKIIIVIAGEKYELVKCRLCEYWYLHPYGAMAGYGKCNKCFWELVKGQC